MLSKTKIERIIEREGIFTIEGPLIKIEDEQKPDNLMVDEISLRSIGQELIKKGYKFGDQFKYKLTLEVEKS